jgi:hypothetical protein
MWISLAELFKSYTKLIITDFYDRYKQSYIVIEKVSHSSVLVNVKMEESPKMFPL